MSSKKRKKTSPKQIIESVEPQIEEVSPVETPVVEVKEEAGKRLSLGKRKRKSKKIEEKVQELPQPTEQNLIEAKVALGVKHEVPSFGELIDEAIDTDKPNRKRLSLAKEKKALVEGILKAHEEKEEVVEVETPVEPVKEEVIQTPQDRMMGVLDQQLSAMAKLAGNGEAPEAKSLIEQKLDIMEKQMTDMRRLILETSQSTIVNGLGAGSPGSGEVKLSKLDDVDITGMSNGQVLSWNETTEKFEFTTNAGGISEVGSLTDVDTTGVQDGNALIYNTTTSRFEASPVSNGGYEFTGGFTDRLSGQSGANDLGDFVAYTAAMAEEDRWYRFGFSQAAQTANDNQYWGETDPAFDQTKGLFGGLHMPSGVTDLFDFSYDDGVGGYSEASDGALKYTAATGSIDFRQARVGDLALVRFDFNVIPQVANTTLEIAMIWATRDANDNITFTFPLTGSPLFYGTGTVGRTFLTRPLLTAYFASQEDVNARALLAIRADNPIQIAPLTTLVTLQR